MNFKIKHIIFFLLITIPFPVFSQLPQHFTGNWINQSNNHWEYGFFEKFAIYDCSFWNYQSVSTDKKGKTDMVLQKGDKTIKLSIKAIDDKQILIKSGKQKFIQFSLMEKEYPVYKSSDKTSFPAPVFRYDSATIVGYYRNLDKVPQEFRNRLNSSPFSITVNDFLLDEQVNYYADSDSLGRFSLTFPVFDTQELNVDWQRAYINAVVEPGDTLFLFADMSDYIPQESDKDFIEYLLRPKQVLFMGDNARINNEMRRFPHDFNRLSRSDYDSVPDMEFLRIFDNQYNKRIKRLNDYIEANPTVSEKFRFYKRLYEKYYLAFDLMQRRFVKDRKEDKSFQDGYMQYVNDNFTLENERVYTLTRNFNIFLNDYIGYYGDFKQYAINTVSVEDVHKRSLENNELSNELKTMLDELVVLLAKSESDNTNEVLRNNIELLVRNLYSNNKFTETVNTMSNEKRIFDSSAAVADSLILNPNLKELWIASRYKRWFDQTRKPFSEHYQTILNEKVKNPDLLNHINRIQQNYKTLANEDFRYKESFKSTEHLREYKEADSLFHELIKPYKGKVIYVDFWGTWCWPCRENMKYANQLKERLKGEDVIFMYFANSSPEESWKNIIKQLDLMGENVVHYRLPEAQQGMLERKLSVKKFPTYMLINKEGNVIDLDAMNPMNMEMAEKQIRELLK